VVGSVDAAVRLEVASGVGAAGRCVGPDGLWRACGRGVATAAWALGGAATAAAFWCPSPGAAPSVVGVIFGLLPWIAGGGSGSAPPST
jgi:hypothetical protein